MTEQQDVRELASAHGIASEYVDARGTTVQVDLDVLRKLLDSVGVGGKDRSEPASALRMPPCRVVTSRDGQVAIPLPIPAGDDLIGWRVMLEKGDVRCGKTMVQRTRDSSPILVLTNVPLGYHRLEVDSYAGAISLIVTPGHCWLPEHLVAGEKSWGVSLQLYLLRSQSNWGIGDFSDLGKLARQFGKLGCDVIGLNPLHQMFLDEPEQASPYSPSDRQFLNVLNIDVEAIAEFLQSGEAKALMTSPDFQKSLQQCRASTSVDYAAVNALKLDALRLVYATFVAEAAPSRIADFRAFVEEAGEPLHRASLFQALRWHVGAQRGHSAAPDTWPEGLRSATSCDTARFALSRHDEIAFLNWLQWIADRQLKAASDEATAAGMRIGLYRDLAVGCDGNGGESWSDPDAFIKGAQVGAPPDILNPAGQNWGLPPFNPRSLIDRAYAPFINLIRANMRYAGGVRIDHVMGLQRLYCIPEGSKGGAYVSYPIDDLIGILALESHRHRCIVVGEDLGTVPAGFREKLAAANILSYRVTFFEQSEDGAYIPPDEYPVLAVAVAGSHDLPTLGSWLSGSDIDLRHSLGLYPSAAETDQQRQYRTMQKAAICKVLELPQPIDDSSFVRAVHAFLTRTSSALVVAQLDDLLNEQDPVNVPGTSTEHPNWRRKYSVELERLLDKPLLLEAICRLQQGRSNVARETVRLETPIPQAEFEEGAVR